MQITPEELRSCPTKVQVVDVRLPEVFEEAHIAGAKSNCVHEVEFLSRLETVAPDRGAKTVIYGPDDKSSEAIVAFWKLTRQGYSDLAVLEGGFESAATSLPVEKGQPMPTPAPAPDGRYLVDLEESRCEWTGRNLINKHTGTVAFSSGHLVFHEGNLLGGEIILDLKEITCSDLEGSSMHQVLIDHLQSDDFFDVENSPIITVAIDKMSQGETFAKVTMKGVTHPVRLQTREGLNDEGLPVAQAFCSIDRTKWGVIYGSKKFFTRLAGHFVHDEIELDLRIVTKRGC